MVGKTSGSYYSQEFHHLVPEPYQLFLINRLHQSIKTDDIIRRAQAKVSPQLMEELVTLTELSRLDLLSLIGFSDQDLVNIPKGESSILTSENLLLLRSLFDHGLVVFDHNKAALTKWLETPLPELA